MSGLTLTLIGLALILAMAAHPAQAHGGGTPQLTNVRAGPYRVSVWTQPDPIRAGELHITVAVSEAPGPQADAGGAGAPVLDATVRVQAQPVGRAGEALVAFATRENAVNKLFYEADMELPSEGNWQVVIEVEGPAGAGSADFEIQVLPPSALNSLGGLPWPLWGGLGLGLLTVGWAMWAFRTQDDYRPSRADRGQRSTVDGLRS